MGKRKKNSRGNVPDNKKFLKPIEDGESLLDPSSRNFFYDEVDNFHDVNESSSVPYLIHNDNTKEEHVLGIGGLTSSDDSEADEDDGSIESNLSNDDDDLFEDIEKDRKPRELDERLLGRRKSDFYGTDIPDEKIHNETRRRGKGDPLSLIEQSAKDLQTRMAAQLKGLSSSYLLPEVKKSDSKELKSTNEAQINIDNIPKKKAQKMLKKNSPEFLPTIDELKIKCNELRSILSPLIKAKKKGLLPSDLPCLEYLQELEQCEKVYGPQLTSLLSDLKSGKLKKIKPDIENSGPPKRKMLSILTNKRQNKNAEEKIEQEPENSAVDSDEELDDVQDDFTNAQDDSTNAIQTDSSENDDDDDDKVIEDKNANNNVLGSEDRRAISYEISKNKGLMPSRKKDQRNPRVKYRNKYSDKLKRRKGQVREVRKEINRYGGEISGIKANLVKSIKLK